MKRMGRAEKLFYGMGSAIVALTASVTANAADAKPVETVPRVDLNKYLGKWYEIARFPAFFQKNCYASTAEYSLRDDGDIRVINSCHKGSRDGKLKVSEGKAWVTDKETNAKLKVMFVWPFSGKYWVIDLGAGYEYAVVGEPDRDYLWILSRTPEMDPEVYSGILDRLKAQGYDTSKLIRT